MLTMAPMLPNSPPAGSAASFSAFRPATAVCTHWSISGAHASGSIQGIGPPGISRYMYMESEVVFGNSAEKT